MAQISRKLKMEDEDLISKLPDEILTHILSFFPTKFAVATCVLSKRWKLLWISVPNLEFDSFYRLSNSTTYEERKVHFEKLVDYVLSLNNVMSVRNVKLDCRRTDVLRANAWFKSLVKRDAENFDLYLPRAFLSEDSLSSSMNFNLFPDRFFNQQNLVELKLNNVVLKVPPLVCFPCLKTIEFQLVRFREEESMKNLLSGCPVLTNLCITDWKCLNILTLYVCSSTLQKLNLYTYHGKDSDLKVVIDAPKLAFLNLEGGVSATYDVINMSSLVSASLSYATDVEPIFEFLRKISHVKELFLNQSILRLFENAALQKLPMFYSLIHLTLEIHRKQSLTVWPRLLEYTPNVVNIVLKPSNQSVHWLWNMPLDLPQSILSSIESIEITKESGQPRPVISCILRNATALKKLSFHGLPICYVQRHSFLKTFLTESQIKYASVNLIRINSSRG